MDERNWAGSHRYAAERITRPRSLDELRATVAAAEKVRVLGTRHSFNAMADSTELVVLDALGGDVVVAPDRRSVSLPAALTYGALAQALAPHDLALHNLASLPHIGVAGAIATATHGSGDGNGNLATAVRALELVTSAGELLRLRHGDADFAGAVVGLGALGAVTRVTLAVEPAYDVAQRVYERLAWARLDATFDELMATGYSVSVLTRLGGAHADQVWVKRRADAGRLADELLGARAADGPRHMIPGIDPVNCTPQLDLPGSWADRLSHFRMGFTPSAGEELQSEYHVARADAVAALRAVRELAAEIDPLLQVCELRSVAADGLWLSPQHGRDTLGIHFTWRRERAAVERVLARIEAALARYDARPHRGKLFLARPVERYERAADFSELAARLDPRGAFRNAWLEANVLTA